MPTRPAVLQDRLSEMVANLSGQPQIVARDAMHEVITTTGGDDLLRHVAAALVLLRRVGC